MAQHTDDQDSQPSHANIFRKCHIRHPDYARIHRGKMKKEDVSSYNSSQLRAQIHLTEHV
uniref:Uncharacterized protein n=1 Tax=Arion vulgaris TaxID=1028688 RepID=A0A0B7BHU9_9EUPU